MITVIKTEASNYFFFKLNCRRVKNDTTGLIDTVIGSNSSWHEHFSATATANYNELGNLFPELLRLAELAKLTAIAVAFQHRYRELRKIVLPPSIEVSDS
jgi:hypothetical protein